MSAADDVQRMLVLVPWLLERPGAHVNEIAEAFHSTPEQIRKDLALLDFCGLPGLRGGDLFDVTIINDRATIDLADELRRPLKPTPSEAVRMVLLIDAVRVALNDTVPALASASLKLRAMLALPPERFGVVADDTFDHPLTVLRDAISAQQQVSFTYLGRNDEVPKQRHVDPVCIHVMDGNWYLEAFDHDRNEGRLFHTDRITDVSVLHARATDHDLASLIPAYQPQADDAQVELTITKPGQWILDHLVLAEQTTTADGNITARLATDALPYIARLVLMARGKVRVTAPPKLRDMIATLAANALAGYNPLTDSKADV
ncbi:MAG: WYL domain-containing protein [Nitriliruptoraceae bacterium]